MNPLAKSEDRTVLLTIQNSKKPDQIIHLVMVRPDGHFETDGLSHLFGVKEIRAESQEVLQSLETYAQLFSFLVETMSTAQDLNLPYHYQSEFEFDDAKYTLYEDGNYRRLKRVR